MMPCVNVNNKKARDEFHSSLIYKVLYAWKYKDANIISQFLNNLSNEHKNFHIEAIEYWLCEYAGFRIEKNLNSSTLFRTRMNYRGKSSSPIGHTFTYDRTHLDILKDKNNRYWKVVPVKIQSLGPQDNEKIIFSQSVDNIDPEKNTNGNYLICSRCNCKLRSENYEKHMESQHSLEAEQRKEIERIKTKQEYEKKRIEGESLRICNLCGQEIKKKNLEKHRTICEQIICKASLVSNGEISKYLEKHPVYVGMGKFGVGQDKRRRSFYDKKTRKNNSWRK